MARTHLLVLLFLVPLAIAQNQSLTKEGQLPKKFVFSSPVTEADCRELPTSSFDVRASGPRWDGRDSRSCSPMDHPVGLGRAP